MREIGRRLRAAGMLAGLTPLLPAQAIGAQPSPRPVQTVPPTSPPAPAAAKARSAKSVKCKTSARAGGSGIIRYEGNFAQADGKLALKDQTTVLEVVGQPRPEEVPVKLPFAKEPQHLFTPDDAKVMAFFEDGRFRGAVFATAIFWQADWPEPGTTVTFRRGGRPLATLTPQQQTESGVLARLPDGLLAQLSAPFEVVIAINGVSPSSVGFAGIDPASVQAAGRASAEWPRRYAGTSFDGTRRGGRPDEDCETGCWLTTAAVGTVGLADDCWELRTLRGYRDRVLARGGPAAALVGEYRAIAPGIVAGISRRDDAPRIWLRTWATGIVPAALAARLGADRVALALYARLTRRLARLAAG